MTQGMSGIAVWPGRRLAAGDTGGLYHRNAEENQ